MSGNVVRSRNRRPKVSIVTIAVGRPSQLGSKVARAAGRTGTKTKLSTPKPSEAAKADVSEKPEAEKMVEL